LVKQLEDAQTSLSIQDCQRPSANPSPEEESAHISLIPFANINGFLDYTTPLDNFRDPAMLLAGNISGSFQGSQRISEGSKLFPSIDNMDINLELDAAAVGQFSIENNIFLQRDGPSAEETFGTDSFNWIEDLMASDLPSLEYDWPREEGGATATLSDLSSSPNTLFDWGGMAFGSTDVAPVNPIDSQLCADSNISYAIPKQFPDVSRNYPNILFASRSSPGSPFGAQAGRMALPNDEEYESGTTVAYESQDVGWFGRRVDTEPSLEAPTSVRSSTLLGSAERPPADRVNSTVQAHGATPISNTVVQTTNWSPSGPTHRANPMRAETQPKQSEWQYDHYGHGRHSRSFSIDALASGSVAATKAVVKSKKNATSATAKGMKVTAKKLKNNKGGQIIVPGAGMAAVNAGPIDQLGVSIPASVGTAAIGLVNEIDFDETTTIVDPHTPCSLLTPLNNLLTNVAEAAPADESNDLDESQDTDENLYEERTSRFILGKISTMPLSHIDKSYSDNAKEMVEERLQVQLNACDAKFEKAEGESGLAQSRTQRRYDRRGNFNHDSRDSYFVGSFPRASRAINPGGLPDPGLDECKIESFGSLSNHSGGSSPIHPGRADTTASAPSPSNKHDICNTPRGFSGLAGLGYMRSRSGITAQANADFTMSAAGPSLDATSEPKMKARIGGRVYGLGLYFIFVVLRKFGNAAAVFVLLRGLYGLEDVPLLAETNSIFRTTTKGRQHAESH